VDAAAQLRFAADAVLAITRPAQLKPGTLGGRMSRARLSTLTAVFVVGCSGNHPVPVKPIGLSPTSCYPPVKADANLDELLDAGPDPCYQADIKCNRACQENRCDLPPSGGPLPIGGGCAHRCRADTREAYLALAAAFGEGRCW
jgi:hypothetical protein